MTQQKLNFGFDSKGEQVVEKVKISTFKKEITSANIIEVEVGTTGYCGGDSGHGGRTYFCIKDLASTDMRCKVKGYSFDEKQYKSVSLEDANFVEIVFGGDCELDTFVEALRFAADTLEHQGAHGVLELSPKEIRQESFRSYLYDLIKLYADTQSLRGMTEIRDKYKVAGLTKIQFFEYNLCAAARDKQFLLDRSLSDKIYEFCTKKQPKDAELPRYESKKQSNEQE